MLSILLFLSFANAATEAGPVTEYYTMVNASLNPRHCATEGNQIVRGRLYGSDCRPVQKACRWGIGARNTCLRPCEDGAGGKAFRFGQIVKIKPRLCRFGPHRGETIRQVRIVDVGGGVRGTHVDVFQGLCRKTAGGVCRQFATEEEGVTRVPVQRVAEELIEMTVAR